MGVIPMVISKKKLLVAVLTGLLFSSSTQLEAMNEQVEHDHSSILDRWGDRLRFYFEAIKKEFSNKEADNPAAQSLQTYHQLSKLFAQIADTGFSHPELTMYIMWLYMELDPNVFAQNIWILVSNMKPKEIQLLFKKLDRESLLKMALRLVSAQKYKTNLDDLDCVHFGTNIKAWVNDASWSISNKTQLFSQTYLAYVLPLLESFIGAPVTALFLGFNNLSELPDSMSQLINLRDLDLRGNKLTELPDSIGKLINLTAVTLCFNQLTKLPDSFSQLINLTELGLWENQLTALPESFGNLTKLEELDLQVNQFSDDEKQVIRQQLEYLGDNLRF